ncbi:hypothetical protein LDENG_00240450 [Lucifuga dentata]|nr:hypothetical protein LDENG_00240450 [Lucifuga dentata]
MIRISAVQATLQHLFSQNDRLLAAVSSLQASTSPPIVASATPQASVSSPPTALSEPRIPPPERYSGETGACRPFLSQCSLIFELQPSTFFNDRTKIAYVISLLSGKPREWATREWNRNIPICQSHAQFKEKLVKIFGYSLPGREVARGLMFIKQGSKRVSEYAVEFHTLAADSVWNDSALFDSFYAGLSEKIKDELATRELPSSLDSLIEMAIRVDNRLLHRRKERPVTPSVPSGSPDACPYSSVPSSGHWQQTTTVPSSSEEAMQVGRTKLMSEEKQKRRSENRCLYCGDQGHFVANS